MGLSANVQGQVSLVADKGILAFECFLSTFDIIDSVGIFEKFFQRVESLIFFNFLFSNAIFICKI
jgi:hypothetical protein